jgi:hypothetical protein
MIDQLIADQLNSHFMKIDLHRVGLFIWCYLGQLILTCALRFEKLEFTLQNEGNPSIHLREVE